MALITCPECKKEISDSATSCPHCGFTLKKESQVVKKKKGCSPWLFGIIFLLGIAVYYNSQNNSKSVTSDKEAELNISTENIQIIKEHSNAWAVTGLIRNNTSRKIKGYVNIKFLNSDGDIVHTAKARVNDGDTFESGQAAVFDYYTNPENFKDVNRFDVDFVKQ